MVRIVCVYVYVTKVYKCLYIYLCVLYGLFIYDLCCALSLDNWVIILLSPELQLLS